MKKMFLMAVLVMATLSVSAQSRFDQGTLTIQPRIGGTASLMSNMPSIPLDEFDYKGNNSSDIDPKPTGGGTIGVDLEYMFTDRLGLQAGALWGQAGSGWDDVNFHVEKETVKMRDLKIETDYVNVPVTLNYYIAKGLALKAGVQCSFLTRAKFKFSVSGESEGVNSKTDYDIDIKDLFNNFDLSIPVGLSYEFKTPFVIDARYNIGISKVNKESFGGKDSRNGVFTLSFGYKFSL